MNEFSNKRLGDICRVINGRAYSQPELLDYGKYKVLRVGNFFSNSSWYYSDLELEDDKYCDFGDLLFAWSASFGPRIWDGDKTIYHYHIWKMIPNNQILDKTYLYYYLSNKTKSFMSSTHGSIMLHLTKVFIEDLKILYPKNLPTQKSIAKVLSDLDAKIELNNKINRELEAMAKTLYDYWFVQFDFPNANGKPYKSSGGKMVYNAELKREIPEGWVAGSFGDYCPSTGGFAFKSSWWTDKGVSVVKIKDIQEDYSIDISQLAKVDLSDKKVDDKFKAKPGDVLIAMTGATIGKYAIVPITDSPVYVNQRVGYFNLGSNPTKKLPYLINSLSQKYFREVVFSIAGGAAQPNISNEQINSIPLLIPDKSVIENYNQKFSSVYQTILNNQRQNQLLTALRDWLLPMLMNGQVTVKEAEEKLSMAAEPSVKYGN